MFDLMITLAALNAGLSADLFERVCWVESRHRNVITHNDGGSPSYGPCQIKLVAARTIDPRITRQALTKPHVSTRLAALYLARQIRRAGGDIDCGLLLYNQGSTQLTRCSRTQYVRKVKNALVIIPVR